MPQGLGGPGGRGGGRGGMPGGMGGGGMQDMLMQLLMSDPELSKGITNPKIMQAMSSMLGGAGV